MPGFRLFLSAVTSEFGSARDLLGASLRSRAMEIAVQSDFRQQVGSDTTLRKLHDYIRDSSAVVCVIGKRSGGKPSAIAATAFAHMLPAAITEASYTQWEFFFARWYRRRLLVYIATDGWRPDRDPKTDRPDLQAAFLRHIVDEQDLDRDEFDSVDRLCHLVLKQDWPSIRPEPILHLPRASIGADFKGRGDFLRALHASLMRGLDAKVAIVSRAVRGLGGMGKTRAAVEYAWEYRHAYAAVLFASAETPETLDRDLAALAGPLNLPQAVAVEDPVRKAAVLHWLNTHTSWLLTLDNVDTHDSLRAVRALAIGGGCLLLTGRLATFGAGIEPLDLDLLDLDTAVAMLLQRTPGRRKLQGEEVTARELAERDLGRLPLALEHAAGLIEHLGCSFADYQARLRAAPMDVLDRIDPPLSDYDRTVFRTWHASVALVPEAARTLLERLAFLGADPVPDALFDVAASGAGAEDHREALAELARVSLVRRESEPAGVTVHRLVQTVTRAGLAAEIFRQRLAEALGWVDVSFVGDPQDWRTWPHLEPLIPHAEAVASYADTAGVAEPTVDVMGRLAALLRAKALHRRAEPYYRRALAIAQGAFPPEHPRVATHLNNLALLLQATNRLGEAEPLMRRALAIDEASYGPDHPDVAIDLNNLALLLQATNRLGEAEPLMRRALAIDEASYGPDHPRVATHLNNLARLLQATNRLGEAEPLMRRALAIDEASYGPDHPDVATRPQQPRPVAAGHQPAGRGGAADAPGAGDRRGRATARTIRTSRLTSTTSPQLLQATNRLGEAEPLMRRALAIDEASYGPDHPDVAIRLNNLAALLQATNRLAEAEPLMRRALAIDEASFGPDHPDVATDLNNLAQLLQATNRLAEAEPLMRRALAIDEASYGPDHPDVAIRPQQPRPIAAGHEPAGRGGAADAPGAGDRRGQLRPGPSERRDRPQQPRPIAAGHQPAGRGGAADAPRAGDRRGQLRPGPSERRDRPQQPRAVAASHQPAGGGGAADAAHAGDLPRLPARHRPRPPAPRCGDQ